MKRVLIDWGITIASSKPLVYITVGAAKHCGKEIELNLPVNHEQARLLLNTAVAFCKREKECLNSRLIIDIYSIPVTFRQTQSVNDKFGIVWRMLVPDNNGKYPYENGCSPLFRSQFENMRQLS